MRLKAESAMAALATATCTTDMLASLSALGAVGGAQAVGQGADAGVVEERGPAAAPVGDEGVAFGVPDDGAVEQVDERGASAGDFFVGGAVAEAPGVVDAAVGPADGAGVAQAEAGGDLLVG